MISYVWRCLLDDWKCLANWMGKYLKTNGFLDVKESTSTIREISEYGFGKGRCRSVGLNNVESRQNFRRRNHNITFHTHYYIMTRQSKGMSCKVKNYRVIHQNRPAKENISTPAASKNTTSQSSAAFHGQTNNMSGNLSEKT